MAVSASVDKESILTKDGNSSLGNIHANRILQVYWSHVPREANFAADHLAKKGQHLPFGLHTFDSVPAEIAHILVTDIAAVPLFRGLV
ncbi:hypothetical protein Ahy_A10g048439 [Arachis hypogaea]|uniref:RNase H type-1 domain-containing protein n=1 Tax=Arachis hypogaea TaxID=3818 RepID=A0A445B594_ARAHY|nr:hypothetical protein Ahy_A10g048439 [Arachis hypogaea]